MGGPRKASVVVVRSGGDLEAARAAKARLIPLLKPHLPDAAVGITRDGKGFAVKVNLCQPLRKGFEIPKTVGGVKVRAEVVGAIRACRVRPPRARTAKRG